MKIKTSIGYKEIDLTHLVPRTSIKTEDIINFNHNPTLKDIRQAKESDKILICHNPSDAVIKLVKELKELNDDLVFYIFLFQSLLSNRNFEEIIKQRYTQQEFWWTPPAGINRGSLQHFGYSVKQLPNYLETSKED